MRGWFWAVAAMVWARKLGERTAMKGRTRVSPFSPNPRARARGARRWRRELGGGVRQHPGSNNCVEGGLWHRSLCGARARGERWAYEIDLRGARAARRACGALCAAAGGRRAAADVDRLLVAIGRCWRRRGSAPRAGDDGATAQQRATNTTLAATRRHPCLRMVAADCAWFRSRPENRSWRLAALNDQAFHPALALSRRILARAREGRGAGGAS